MSQAKVFYFGYGANRDPRMISSILGKPESDLIGRPAVLEGFDLAIQKLDQVPDVVLPTAPANISPQQNLREEWGNDFRSYVIMPNPEGRVSGTIWELTPEERERIRDWELLDFGWYDDAEGRAVTPEGGVITVVSEKLGQGQRVECTVDGMDYETWLDDPEKFRIVAEKARREYDLRQEGHFRNDDLNKS